MRDVHNINEKLFKYSLVLGCFTSLEIVISVIMVVRTETCWRMYDIKYVSAFTLLIYCCLIKY